MSASRRIVLFAIMTVGLIIWWWSVIRGVPTWALAGPVIGTLLWIGVLVKIR